jgi:hypothetical protein
MDCIIGGKIEYLEPEWMMHDKFIGDGTSGNVYLINGEAYKLYRPYCKTENMSEEAINILKTIHTKNIILPRECILDIERNLVGYISKYIKDYGYEYLLTLPKEKVLTYLYNLKEDLITLGKNKITVKDLYIENTSFNNNGIYIIDCGRFLVGSKNYNDENLSCSDNLDQFNSYVIKDILCGGRPEYYKYDELIRHIISQKKNDIDIIDFLDKDMQSKTIEEYMEDKKIR